MKTLALLLFWALPARAEDGALTSFVEGALARDPAVAAARAAADEARARRSETAALSLPRLSAKASYTRSDDPLFAFGAILEERSVEASHFGLGFLREPGYRTRTMGALEVGAPLFTGFQLSAARRQAGLGADAAAAGLRALTEDRRRAAVDAALESRAAAARWAALSERAASASTMVADAQRLVKSGMVLGSDYSAAQALLAKLRGQAALEARRFEGARARMHVLSGGAAAAEGPLSGVPPALPEAPALTAAAAEHRGDLAAARFGVSAAAEARTAAERSLLPRVEGFAQVQDSGRNFLDGGTSRLVGLRAEIPFGDAGFFPRRARARAAALRAEAGARAAAEETAAAIANARASYAGALEALPLIVESRDKAKESLELFRPLYRQGRQSVLEVLRAEDALAQAELAVVDARKGLYVGWAGLRQAAGTLDAEAVAALDAALEVRP